MQSELHRFGRIVLDDPAIVYSGFPLQQISKLEKSLVERALRQAAGNKSEAAELLGIHRRLLRENTRMRHRVDSIRGRGKAELASPTLRER